MWNTTNMSNVNSFRGKIKSNLSEHLPEHSLFYGYIYAFASIYWEDI